MNDASPKLRHFADRLVAFEADGDPSLRKETPTAMLAIDRLRPALANLTGTMGFQALLSRALALAARENAWMAGLQVKPDGTVDGFGEAGEKVAAEDIGRGCKLLFALLHCWWSSSAKF